jgi:hypothetical protein
MINEAFYEWLNEAEEEMMAGPPEDMGSPPPEQSQDTTGGPPPTDAPMPTDAAQTAPEAENVPDYSEDPSAPDMPEEAEESQDFEQWKNTYFKESIKGDSSKLIDLIHQVRDLELESYPRKFVEDNLQVCFLRQYANIDKASQMIRKQVKDQLDKNNPTVSLVNHMSSALQVMPELNNIFIKLKGLLGMKGDLHRKLIASLIGGVQVGSGGNNEDVIYNEREYSIRLSTRFNDKWGRVDLGKWSLKQDDASQYLTDPEQKRLEEGSPEEKDVLRRRIVMESIAETFQQRGFLIHVVGENGTIYNLGWDIASSLRNAYTDGKLVVRTFESDNSEAMINDEGQIIPYVDIKIKYLKETGEVDEAGKPVQEEIDFMEKIDGILFLTATLNTLQETNSVFSGMVLKEVPYTGNPSDLKVLMRCVPSASEILTRSC